MSIRDEILELKRKKGALIVAHFYQDAEIQDLADYVGDSLGMAVYARESESQFLVVCGVRFMAETLKAMNMEKKVVLPDLNAGCSLADSCTPQVFSYFKSKYPNAFAMTYVNSSLEVKALSDVIVTSSNAVEVAKKAPKDRPLIFGPDQHLGRHVAKELGRDMILFPGNCFIHTSFSVQEMLNLKAKHPDALIIAHPECEDTILRHADYIGSTNKLLKFSEESSAQEFIVMTEAGILHQMRKASPQKVFFEGPDINGCACNICPHMKLNTLEKLKQCLTDESPEILIDPDLARQALIPLNRMMEMTG